MITKKDEQEFKKPKLLKIWNFLIYGSFIAIGLFLVYLYSSYIFINKWHMYCVAFAYGMFSVLLLDVLDHITIRMKLVKFLCPLKKEIIICSKNKNL